MVFSRRMANELMLRTRCGKASGYSETLRGKAIWIVRLSAQATAVLVTDFRPESFCQHKLITLTLTRTRF